MLTKEQKEQRKQEREAARAEEALNFPGARYSDETAKGNEFQSIIQIVLEEGSKWSIQIRTNDLKQFNSDPCGADSGWVRAHVRIDRIEQLAELIRAMTARLNYLVANANAEIDSIPAVKSLHKAHGSS